MAEDSSTPTPQPPPPPPPITEQEEPRPPPPITEQEEPPPPPPITEQEEQPPPPITEQEEPPPPPPITEQEEQLPPPITEQEEPPPLPAAPMTAEGRSLAAMMEKESSSSPTTTPPKSKQEVVETEQEKPLVKHNIPQSLISFKEESNIVADLSEVERKALQEFKKLVQEALNNHQFASKEENKQTPEAEPDSDKSTEIKPPPEEENPEKQAVAAVEEAKEEVFIWGVPLLKDDRSDVILLKFLRAREFKVMDAFTMIKNTIKWRKEFGIDRLVDEDLGDDLEKVVFMHGYDRDGHPVCYNVYGEFQNKELYQKTFSDEERRMKFLRWRIQYLERSIRKLDFKPGGICTIFQVNDLKNSPGPGKRELRLATKQAVQLLQDNYPEFVAKQVFINVPWWYLAFYTMISPFMTQRTKSKFVFAGPSKSAETLFKYISPAHVPIQYGGLSVDYCDCNPEFTIDDPVTDITVKPATKQTVEIIIYEKCIIVWEIRVVGWEVSYGAEFVPDAKDQYAIIIQKPTKMAPADEPVVCTRFKVGNLGKVLLTIDNPTSKKKKFLYRFKIEPFSD
ncbi:patellin-3 [Pistacia vera]|uniref:patellin-3 n=1 Tax=Pistacia vera TaxID=55513 RepID=UPI00126386B0|nr:patellin-3 [Pistacia vera]